MTVFVVAWTTAALYANGQDSVTGRVNRWLTQIRWDPVPKVRSLEGVIPAHCVGDVKERTDRVTGDATDRQSINTADPA